MKTILVPTDFSECAGNAARVAADLARQSQAKVILMHIINMPTYGSNTSIDTWHDVTEGLFIMKHVKNKFTDLLASPFLEGLEVEELVEFNSVYEAIAKIAKERNADLIIMGSQGTSGTEEMLVGSNTERVIRSSEVPVLTIKNASNPFKVNDIVFASNFFEESYTVFNQIQKFRKLFGSHIHLLKVITPSYFESTHYSLKLMEDFAKKMKLESNYSVNIYNDSSIEEGIHHFTDVVNADLIAMETHGRTGIKHLLWGSITEGVANHSKIPVLSVRIPKDVDAGNVIFPD